MIYIIITIFLSLNNVFKRYIYGRSDFLKSYKEKNKSNKISEKIIKELKGIKTNHNKIHLKTRNLLKNIKILLIT